MKVRDFCPGGSVSLLQNEATMNHLASLLLLTAALCVPACQVDPPRSPDQGLNNVDPPQNPDLGRYPARASIDIFHMWVTDSVRGVCSGPAPFFEFDSASMDQDDRSTMANLAQCMKSGPLQGKSIRLIGRTDPRGTEEYNEKLGLERAEKVKRYLVRRGVEGDRIQVTSLGKQDASPSPSEWPGDRRVQIELAQ